jgi:hypothetical protein
MAGTAAALDAADLLLLLPSMPATLTCPRGFPTDGVARRWRIRLAGAGAPASTLVADGGSAALAIGRRAVEALVADYRTTSVWEVWGAAGGATALVPAGRRDLVDDMHARFGRPRLRSSFAAFLRGRATRREVVGVGDQYARGVVAGSEYAPAGSSYVVVFTDPRRRAAVVDPARGFVVKVARAVDQGERAQWERAVRDKLQRADLDHVPPIVASATEREPTWLAEELSRGRSLETRHQTEAALRSGVVDNVAAWLGDLAVKTRSDTYDPTSGLRGEHAALVHLATGLVAVPGVLVHGDLAMGGNILVEGGDFSVLDWETAREDALPLLDLLPMLCLTVARAEVGSDAVGQAAVALQLCRGDHDRSSWLFQHVDRYLGALSIDRTHAGALAALAWGVVASMRLAHAELVATAGQQPTPWVSPAEHVARQWMNDPLLGSDWKSFISSTGGR